MALPPKQFTESRKEMEDILRGQGVLFDARRSAREGQEPPGR